MAKKKQPSLTNSIPPLRSYRQVNNRCLIVDWASLAYHQVFSLNTAKNREKYGFQGAEGEVRLWRTFMIEELLKLISLFNPMHLVFALEGKNSWRNEVVREYYGEHSTVYYITSPEKRAYFVKSDNKAYEVQKAIDGQFIVKPISVDNMPKLESLEHMKLNEFPQRVQDMLWGVKTAKGDPIIPAYKGTRSKNEWPFSIDRKVWRKYKEQFAKELAPLFRARAVECPGAEGDDVIYAAAKKFRDVCDDVIVVTHDSDMLQIGFSHVRIFDHIQFNFMTVDDPVKYLDVKVLAGDDSDNINGMAFVKQKTGELDFTVKNQFGPPTAAKFLERFPNVYDVAKNNGWGDQYMRNRRLIDLSCVPETVSMSLDAELSRPEPNLCGFELLDFWQVEDYYKELMQNMRSYGYRTMIPAEMAARRMPVEMPEVSQSNGMVYVPIPKSEAEPDNTGMRRAYSGFTVNDIDPITDIGKLL